MPELRLNVITRDWVIIATERAHKPDKFVYHRTDREPLPSFQENCPFCPGNESMTAREVLRFPYEQQWKVRVVTNKYPALSSEGERHRTRKGMYQSMNGVGLHEVIVEHPRHDLTTALFSYDDMADVLRIYRQRYREIKNDPRMEAVILFRNHGEIAGSSVAHPHSQLAATPVVPFQFRARIEEAIRFFDDSGECIFCRTLSEELASKERVVLETDCFVAFIPYAALSPFHTWIFPKRHMSSYDEITDTELADLATNLRTVVGKLYHGLNDPPYNYTIRSIPTRVKNTDYYHWYLSIIPRVIRTAGFEMGSGMFINTALPEESAKFLREISEPTP